VRQVRSLQFETLWRLRDVWGRLSLLPSRYRARDELTGDNLVKRWPPRVRLLFLIGACFLVWTIVAVVALILTGGPDIHW
jgi:hypothetical protein